MNEQHPRTKRSFALTLLLAAFASVLLPTCHRAEDKVRLGAVVLANPAVEVNSTSLAGWHATTNGVNVVAGETVSVRLANSAGVRLWQIAVVGSDENVIWPTIAQAGIVSGSATFTAPATPSTGWSLIFRSQIGVTALGNDASGRNQPAYSTTFGVFLPTSNSYRLFATNETTESDAQHGWVSKINPILRANIATGSAVGTDRTLATSGLLQGGGDLSSNRTLSVVPGTNGQVAVTSSGAPAWALIANSNISSSAAIDLTKLSQASASSGQVIAWNGSQWAPASASGVGGGAGCSVADLAALRALLSSNQTNNASCSVGSPVSTWGYSSSSGAGFTDDGKTVVKPNDLSNGSNGRWYTQAGAPIVATVAAVRLAVAGKHDSVQFQAFSALGDGGGGIADYDSSDTSTSDDGCTVFVAGTRRYKRRSAGAINAAWCGAKSDHRAVTDAGISSGLAQLTSATAAFTSADVGKSVVVQGAKTFNLSGTVATANGTRKLLGTSTKFVEELWAGAPFKIGATSFVLSDSLTGTVATTAGSATLTGTGTKFQDELWTGAEISIVGVKYAVDAIGTQTSATLHVVAAKTTEGTPTAHVRIEQTHALLDTTASSTASGLSATGPAHALITTISSVTNSTTAQVAATADITVSGARCSIGTDNTAALTAAEAVSDHVVVSPGSYLLATSFKFNRQRVMLELLKGSKLYLGNRLVIDNKSCSLLGHATGVDFTNLGGYQPNLLWVGSPGDSVLRLTESDWASSAHVRGIFADANGVGGLTGFLLGVDGMDCSGVRFENDATVDMQIGMNVRAGAQQNYYENVSHYRRDSGTFSTGVGLLVNGDSLVGTAAVTANFFRGGTIQNFQTGIQVGGPFGAGPAVISWQDFVIEGFPPTNGRGVLVFNGGVYHFSNFYTEAPTGDDGSTNGFEIGAPGQVAQKVTIGPRVYIPGYRDAIKGYGWDGLEVYGNAIDISSNGTATNKTSAFRNVGGGTNRRQGKWLWQSKVAPGSNTESTEVVGTTGFVVVEADNTDSGDQIHPRQDIYGNFHADTIDGTTAFPDVSNFGASSHVNFAAGALLAFAGNGHNWTTDAANYAYFNTDLGLMVRQISDSSGGTPIKNMSVLLRTSAFSGSARNFDLSIKAVVDAVSGGTGSAPAPVTRGELLFGNGGNSGPGWTDDNVFYMGTGGPSAKACMRLALESGTPTATSKAGSIAISTAGGISTLPADGSTWQQLILSGTGSPEGAVTARIGALYGRRDGGANTTLYVKESGTGNTGWVAK